MSPVLFFRSDVCSDDELSFVEMFAVHCFFEMTTVDIGRIGGGAPGLWEGFLRAQTCRTGGWGWDVHCTAIIFIEGHLRPPVGLLPQTGQLRTLSDHRPVAAVSVHKKS